MTIGLSESDNFQFCQEDVGNEKLEFLCGVNRGVLETVLIQENFDLNDDVLMEFNDYFDRESRHYNLFSLQLM